MSQRMGDKKLGGYPLGISPPFLDRLDAATLFEILLSELNHPFGHFATD